MAESWRQLLLDWDKRGRNAGELAAHLRLCGLPEATRKFLVAVFSNGEKVGPRDRPQYQLEASHRKLAGLAGVAPGTISKVVKRLLGEACPLLRCGGGLYIISMARIWGLATRKPAPLASPARREPPVEPAEPAALPRASARFRPYQDQERDLTFPQDPRTKNGDLVLAQDCVEALPGGAVWEQHAAQLDRLGSAILESLAPLEDRAGVEGDARLKLPMARRIADGMCEAGPEAREELEGILGWIAARPSYDVSPAACLVKCAKRRGWVQTGGNKQ